MAYRVTLRDGSSVTVAEATSSMRNGSGTYLYDKDGRQVASWGDGVVHGCYPADSVVEAAPPPEEAAS